MISRSLLVAGIALASVPVLGVAPAHACSCIAAKEAEHFERAGAVFKGTVAARAMPPDRAHAASVVYTFDVSRVYKGAVLPRQQVRTARDSATCGVNLTGKGPFLVFANRDRGAEATAPLSMNLCGGTRAIAADAQPAFGPGTPVDPPADPDPGEGSDPDEHPEGHEGPPAEDGDPGGLAVMPSLTEILDGVLGPLG